MLQQNEFKRGWAVLLGAFIGSGVGLASMVYYSTGIWILPLAGRIWLDARRNRFSAIHIGPGDDASRSSGRTVD